MAFADWPIRRKLVAMLLAISGMVLLLTSAAFVAYQYWSFRQSARNVLSVRGRILAANTTASLAFADEADATEILSALRIDRHIVAAALYDTDGRLFATYQDRPGSVPPAPGLDGYRFERGLLIGFEPVAEGGSGRLGTLYLASDLGELYGTFRLSGLIGVAVTAASLLVAYLMSTAFQGSISRPLLRLTETARAVSDHRNYAVRAPRAGHDELGVLTDAFNHMLGRIEGQDRVLRQQTVELQRYAGELEQRVAERTHELEERNEALRRNAAEILVANQELDAFAYSVSHDLRAPLRSIDGFSQVLLEDSADRLDDAGRDALHRVRAASQRMAALIDDLLKLARVTRTEIRTEVVDLSAMAAEIVADLQRASPGRRVDVAIAPGLTSRGDPRLLRVALDNLLGNSWKYTANQPHARVEFGTSAANGQRTFHVRDNGAGFDMQYADKLFGVFQRLHTTAEFEGTGVGLATVRRILTRHGGRIWAEGAVGQGATFYFTL